MIFETSLKGFQFLLHLHLRCSRIRWKLRLVSGKGQVDMELAINQYKTTKDYTFLKVAWKRPYCVKNLYRPQTPQAHFHGRNRQD